MDRLLLRGRRLYLVEADPPRGARRVRGGRRGGLQFEAGRENVGKNGVVRDQKVHIAVVEEIIDFCLNNGFSVLGLSFSPIKGPQGNIEYLLYIKRSDAPQNNLSVTAEEVVEQSHETLDK